VSNVYPPLLVERDTANILLSECVAEAPPPTPPVGSTAPTLEWFFYVSEVFNCSLAKPLTLVEGMRYQTASALALLHLTGLTLSLDLVTVEV